MPTLKWLVTTTLVIYLIMLVAMFFLQRQLMYFPHQPSNYQAEHNFELQNQGITLRGWAINQGRSSALLYYGGNAERIDYYIANFKLLFPAHTVYLVNYRGYGKSEGAPAEQDLFSDALAIYDSISHKHDSISVLGKSLGSGIASYVAASRPVKKVALVTPYDSMVNVAKFHYPLFPINLLLTDRYESWKYAEKITAPTLIITAQNDQIIPAKSTNNLAAHFNASLLTTKQISDSDHNSISGEPLFYETLVDYFGQI